MLPTRKNNKQLSSQQAGEQGAQRRSRSGLRIEYRNTVIYTTSTLQKCVTLSSIEAELAALSETLRTIPEHRRELNNIDTRQPTIKVYQDSVVCIRSAEEDIGE